MVAIKNLLFVAAAASALVIPRDVTPILNDLKKIDAATLKLAKAVSAWDGQIGSAAPIASDESALEADLKAATADAKKAKAANSADSKTIVAYINKTLQPDISKSMSAMTAKKADLQKAGLISIVKGDLQKLKSESDDLGAALLAKASKDQKAPAKAAQAKIDQVFTKAIASLG